MSVCACAYPLCLLVRVYQSTVVVELCACHVGVCACVRVRIVARERLCSRLARLIWAHCVYVCAHVC